MEYRDIIKIYDIFNLIYIYIIYVIFYPILYTPFAIINRIRNKSECYSNKITQKLLKYLNCDIIYVNDNKIIESGFILANHRCSFDFIFDPHISKSSIVGRYKAVLSTFFLSILGIIERRIIYMQKTFSRNFIFDKMKKHIEYNSNLEKSIEYNKRITYYPEGSRLNYTSIDNIDVVKSLLKHGLIKSIYEYKKMPIQIILTKNKEKVYNEFTLNVEWDVKLPVYISKEINPNNFNNYEEFYNHICDEWYKGFNVLYSS